MYKFLKMYDAYCSINVWKLIGFYVLSAIYLNFGILDFNLNKALIVPIGIFVFHCAITLTHYIIHMRFCRLDDPKYIEYLHNRRGD